jgi:aminopeptidase N
MKKIFIIGLTFIGFQTVFSQNFTRKDSLQGGLRPERTCFDVMRYNLNIKINIDEKSIVGYNEISFKIIENTSKIQIDLFQNMQVDSILYNAKKLDYKRDNNAVFIDFPNKLTIGNDEKIRFYYSGKPIIARRAPWDGGFVFTKDKQGKPWIGVACQGTGASLWYPVKDSQSDEPDNGATIKVAVPNGLMDVSNGKLIGSEDLKNGYTRWDWEVKNPINTYDITVNIADYAHIQDNLNGLDINYYVLKENEEKAKVHFEEVKPMLTCFQSKFGKYPFFEDGYKLVETPYLGMEHQSAVAYGNKFKKGYLGSDLSGTGIGLLFDYITIVFIECQYGYEKAMIYCEGLQRNVNNDKPIIGSFGVNNEGSGDMYPKGALLLNTLRHVFNNDTLWWKLILKYSETFRHKIIDTETVIAFFNQESAMNLTPIFNQYLKYTTIPILELKWNKKKLEYKWTTDVTDFNMPIDIKVNGEEIRLKPTNNWCKIKLKIKSLDEIEVLKSEFFVAVSK